MCISLCAVLSSVQYPCSRAVYKGRVHGPWIRVPKMTLMFTAVSDTLVPIFDTRVHGPWTARVHGPWTRGQCIPSLRSGDRWHSSLTSIVVVLLFQVKQVRQVTQERLAPPDEWMRQKLCHHRLHHQYHRGVKDLSVCIYTPCRNWSGAQIQIRLNIK